MDAQGSVEDLDSLLDRLEMELKTAPRARSASKRSSSVRAQLVHKLADELESQIRPPQQMPLPPVSQKTEALLLQEELQHGSGSAHEGNIAIASSAASRFEEPPNLPPLYQPLPPPPQQQQDFRPPPPAQQQQQTQIPSQLPVPQTQQPQQLQQHQPPRQDEDVCGRCQQPIGIGLFLKELGTFWHAACFTCAQCKGELVGPRARSGGYFLWNGQPVCARCYRRICGQ